MEWTGWFGPHAVAWHGGEAAQGPCRYLARWPGCSWSASGGGALSSAPGGGGEPAVGAAGQLPAALMDAPVMGSADQGQVVQLGGAAVDPVPQMMGVTPGQGTVTVGEDTTLVADGEGVALGRGDDP